VETVVKEDEDEDDENEDDDEEELNIMDSTETRDVAAIWRSDPHSKITPENLARRWHIGLDAAKQMMKVTTQLGVRSLVHPAQCRFRTAMPHLRYPRLHGTFYGDIMKSEVKSLRSFKYAHLIGNGKGFSKFSP
jgi:hypothetical protein